MTWQDGTAVRWYGYGSEKLERLADEANAEERRRAARAREAAERARREPGPEPDDG